MKKLVCEICGSADIMKEDGVFICQSCGTKYTVEEARKMMVEGTVEVQGTVRIDNSNQLQNFLELSLNAYNSGNGQSASDYANKALEIEPKNAKAWIAKMKAVEYMGTFGDLKLKEVIEAGKNAVNFAREDQKGEVTLEVYKYEAVRSLELLKLAMNKLSDTAEISRTFKTFSAISILTAPQNTMNADNGTVVLYDKVADEAMAMVQLIPAEAMVNFPQVANIVGECVKQYEYETQALINRYKIYGAKLLASATQLRENKKREVLEKLQRVKVISEEKQRKEKEEKIKKYWEEHPQEKEALESRKIAQEKIKQDLMEQRKNIPCLPEKEMYEKQIATLQKEKKAISLLKMKERQAKQEEIDAIQRKLDVVNVEFNKQLAEIQAKWEQIDNVIKNINAELNKERN